MVQRIRLMAAAFFLGIAGGGAGALEFSGLLDSKVSFTGSPGGEAPFAYEWEEYANIRMRAAVGDNADFYGAVNLIAAAGSSAAYAALPGSAFIAGENYAAAIEPERLYFRLRGQALDADVGLMRLGFGYGQAFSPSDFLNPRSPLFPDARPRAALGAALAAYPQDSLKLQTFTVTPRNPLAAGGSGFIAGFSADRHGDFASVQLLYAYESPGDSAPKGIHRGGLSLKADLELGFAADLLYTWDPAEGPGIAGLAADAGLDYSFLDGDFYVLAEYLYSGPASSTAQSSQNTAGLSTRHNLLGTVSYHVNDYTRLQLTCLFAPRELSAAPVLTLEHDISQGVTLTLSAQAFTERKTLNSVSSSAKVRLRF
ncbi:MAG: hypothetical protein LBL19_00455 [Spirochaetaceae bacterium]|jgi:hypothetical protein|nr:hypothetical protein [Spirochaetaceae bacterium]